MLVHAGRPDGRVQTGEQCEGVHPARAEEQRHVRQSLADVGTLKLVLVTRGRTRSGRRPTGSDGFRRYDNVGLSQCVVGDRDIASRVGHYHATHFVRAGY